MIKKILEGLKPIIIIVLYILIYSYVSSIGYEWYFLLASFIGFGIYIYRTSTRVMLLRYCLMFLWIVICKLFHVQFWIYIIGVLIYALYVFGLINKKTFTNPKEQYNYLMTKFDLFLISTRIRQASIIIKDKNQLQNYYNQNNLLAREERYKKIIKDYEDRGFKYETN